MTERTVRAFLLASAAVVLAGCTGGNDGGGFVAPPAPSPSPAPPPPPPPPSVTGVQTNQVGFLPDATKKAVVVTDATAALEWRLVDGSGTVVAQGDTVPFGVNEGSGQNVQQIDFSTYTTQGSDLHIEVEGVESHPFDIFANVYDKLKYDAIAFYYHQRSGIAIEAMYVDGNEWVRPAAHDPDTATCYGPMDFRGNNWGGCPYTLDASKGWYDAGDQGKYVVNSGVSVWTLLDYYERALSHPAALSATADGTFRIPENMNGVNDLLDEVRWNLEFMLAMQVPDGTTLTLPRGDQTGNLDSLVFSSVDASGMAHHKIHDEHWTPLPTPPHLDPETRYLSYPSTAATLDLAATAAQCARLWRGIDDPFADRCLAAAKKAYAAAKRVPDALAYDVIDGGGGAYGDTNLEDEFYWAATELFITTGDTQYETDMRASPLFLFAPSGDDFGSGDISWQWVAPLGTISLAVAPSGVPAADRTAARNALIATADAYLAQSVDEGYAIPFGRPYVWGSNSDFGNRGLILALAHDFTGDEAYRDGVVDVMDYLLGRNPIDQSYVSGYGERAMMNPHHRFWAHSLDSSLPGPPAGAIAGGSNNQGPSDPVASSIFASCHPQTCYVDDIGAYSLNEVAINWNAPLFWIAAYLDE